MRNTLSFFPTPSEAKALTSIMHYPSMVRCPVNAALSILAGSGGELQHLTAVKLDWPCAAVVMQCLTDR